MNKQILDAALTMKRIDTHSHFYGSFTSLESRTASLFPFKNCIDLADAKVEDAGCKVLYNEDIGNYLDPALINPALSSKAGELRKKGDKEVLEYCLDQAGITTQFCFCDYIPEKLPIYHLTPRLQYMAYIDSLIQVVPESFTATNKKSFNWFQALFKRNPHIKTFDDFINFINFTISAWPNKKVKGLKCMRAYTQGLEFSNHDIDECRIAFKKKDPSFVKEIQDFAYRQAFYTAAKLGLPLIFHTGFTAWGGAPLSLTNPLLLQNLINDDQLDNAIIVLLHGGYPYLKETEYLTGKFKNVYLDFTWLPWLSMSSFRWVLPEWLKTVPVEKFCWGSDSCSPEGIVGIDFITRNLIASSLDDALNQGIIDKAGALRFIESSYYQTAAKLFLL